MGQPLMTSQGQVLHVNVLHTFLDEIKTWYLALFDEFKKDHQRSKDSGDDIKSMIHARGVCVVQGW